MLCPSRCCVSSRCWILKRSFTVYMISSISRLWDEGLASAYSLANKVQSSPPSPFLRDSLHEQSRISEVSFQCAAGQWHFIRRKKNFFCCVMRDDCYFANRDFLSLRKSRCSQLILRLWLSKYIHLFTSPVDNGFSQKVSTFIY